MNFSDLIMECRGYLGVIDFQGFHNFRSRQIRDKINVAVDLLSNSAPNVLCLTQQAQLPLVAGQSIYYLTDWALRPLSAYTTDISARKIRFHRAEFVDRSGLRNTAIAAGQFGPWDVGWSPRNIQAVLAGASGASTGATATEGATTVSLAGNPALTAAHVGRMFRLNGEDGDYKIVSFSGSTITVDRPIRARPPMDDNITYTGGYTNVRWEIGPPQRVQIETYPAPTAAYTGMSYRYCLHPRILLNDDDTPEIPREYHHLIWKGALKELSQWQDDISNYAGWASEFAQALNDFKSQDADDIDGQDAPHYESLNDAPAIGMKNDLYFRNQDRY